MNEKTRNALNAINDRFYRESANDFSISREAPWPGWYRVLKSIASITSSPIRILDLGCGNGRFLHFLHQNLTVPFEYHGVDSSESLLALAEKNSPHPVHAKWHHQDLAQVPLDLPFDFQFDVITLFGLLHHIPGLEERRLLLQALSHWLCPSGILVTTFWRFAEHQRFLKKLYPWKDYCQESPDSCIEIPDLEEGDYLLRWDRGTSSIRYCHYSDDQEIRELFRLISLELLDQFEEDGKSGNLNSYRIYQSRNPEPGVRAPDSTRNDS